MNFPKVEPPKGYELVMRHIRKQIEDEVWLPGQKLPSVVDLAASYGVGRSTIREALSALKAMGWLDIRQGGGTFVRATLPATRDELSEWFQNAHSMKEILEVRLVMETGCASLAAKHRSSEDLIELEGILRRMEKGIADETESEQADADFHLRIARSTKNEMLVQLMDSLSQRMRETIGESRKLWFYKEQATAHRLLQEHQLIFDAIVKQDENEAFERMRSHLHKVAQVLQQMML